MDKNHIVEQTKLAFDFIQKLYLETSYFIKELEGILGQEEEHFQILKPSGYSISTVSSIGLESSYVQQWLLKKGVVFFTSEASTELIRGRTNTGFNPNLKVIVVRIMLNDPKIDEPEVWAGVITNIQPKLEEPSKFEGNIWIFTYNDSKIFKDVGNSEYEDNYWSIKLKLMKKPLYDISSAEDIKREIIDPTLNIYRSS